MTAKRVASAQRRPTILDAVEAFAGVKLIQRAEALAKLMTIRTGCEHDVESVLFAALTTGMNALEAEDRK